jgi:putative flippase GtrA
MDELVTTLPEDPSVRPTLLSRVPPIKVLVRFVLTGALVGCTNLGLVTAMVLLGVDIQVALAVAYLVGLTVHFTLNRQWVFASDEGYAAHFTIQGVRYLCTAALSYAVTAVAVAVLPEVLGIPQLAAFFLITGAVACVSFVILHVWVFRGAPDRSA